MKPNTNSVLRCRVAFVLQVGSTMSQVTSKGARKRHGSFGRISYLGGFLEEVSPFRWGLSPPPQLKRFRRVGRQYPLHPPPVVCPRDRRHQPHKPAPRLLRQLGTIIAWATVIAVDLLLKDQIIGWIAPPDNKPALVLLKVKMLWYLTKRYFETYMCLSFGTFLLMHFSRILAVLGYGIMLLTWRAAGSEPPKHLVLVFAAFLSSTVLGFL
jgi:hypothetical protein